MTDLVATPTNHAQRINPEMIQPANLMTIEAGANNPSYLF